MSKRTKNTVMRQVRIDAEARVLRASIIDGDLDATKSAAFAAASILSRTELATFIARMAWSSATVARHPEQAEQVAAELIAVGSVEL